MASTVLPNGIIIPEKYSRDWYADLYHNWQELDNLLGGGTPKDGTLTIQKNGDTVGTFSANQATDETINIEVPDVNNATLTIQQNSTTVDTFTANSSSDKTVNIQCVDLNSNQTVAGNKEFTGTTTAHDLVPSATDTYNLGSSSAQWNNAYIKSLTINGDLIGSGALSLKSKSGTSRIYLRNNNASAYPSSVNLYSKVGDNPEYGVYLNGQSFHPNITSEMNLGTANLKWKTINGVNPGALSLPSGTVGMDLIGDVSVVGTEKKLSKDITITGFVYVDVSFTSSNRLNLYNDTKKYGIWIPCDNNRIRQIMPISAGDRLEFNVLDDGSTINAIKLFPCQGNV